MFTCWRVPVRPAAASRVKPMTPKSLVNDSSGSSASKARSADSVPARASPSAWSRNWPHAQPHWLTPRAEKMFWPVSLKIRLLT